jgi:NAD(P)-dependent dehydrogenase (short-subunit alcohol dehydrogenase family)
MQKLLSGKVAIVTGGGVGLGRAIAERFLAEGASVIIAGSSERVLATAEAIGATAVRTNVSSASEVAALFGRCAHDFGRLDVLVNNAGITGPVTSAADMDMDEWDHTIAVNVRGVILCTKSAIPPMKERGGGSIINISSLMGLRGYPMRSAYVASKFAVIGITQSVAHEVGCYGIRVNALCPGAVHGELMDRVVARRATIEGRTAEEIIRGEYIDVAALRKWVEPSEVASAALFLASDGASAITGEHVKVDAGRL